MTTPATTTTARTLALYDDYLRWLAVPGHHGPMMLSVKQPWADLITAAQGSLLAATLKLKMAAAQPHFADRVRHMLPKDVENRTWLTRWRGPLLIHSPSTPDRHAMDAFGFDRRDFVYSAVVGLAQLTDVVEDSCSPWAEPGQFHWQLANPVRLNRPVCGPGHERLRPPKPQILADTARALRRQQPPIIVQLDETTALQAGISGPPLVIIRDEGGEGHR